VVSGSTVRQTLTQMMHKPTDPITVELARDICERTASQAVLHGTGCPRRQKLHPYRGSNQLHRRDKSRSAKQEVSAPKTCLAPLKNWLLHPPQPGRVPPHHARFNKPLAPVSTGSLEALRTTAGIFPLQQGHFAEAIELLKQAVAIDPKFAAAYLDLSTSPPIR